MQERRPDDEIDEGSRVRASRKLRSRDSPRDDATRLLKMRGPEAVARGRHFGGRVGRSGEEHLEERSDRRRADEPGAFQQESLEVSPERARVGRRAQRT
jgi:hypothetical protein